MFLSLFVLLVAGISVFGFLRYRDYDSLKNPIDEIYYASVHYKNILGLPDMSKIIRSNTAYVGEPAWINYRRAKPRLADDEDLQLYINSDGLLAVLYSKKLSGETYLNIDYVYEEGFVKQNVSIAFSNVSDFVVQAFINQSKKRGYVRTADEIYRSLGGGEPPRKSLVSKEEILDYLKDYDIDQTWLATKSDQILYTYFLDIWFKEGSQRYSRENMGNLKVKYSETIGKE
ncbi:TipC family immunity protein [Streptococcus cristatus]|uniref:TipC family immunity protein n=1 Tax=Streptococcus cristatus TaxID=45634 RepID=UPI0016533D43|nr:TipC family immunity protein [Streptococcus cristatus]MBC6977324.1 TipC family immunity protein [Streptococcus cristatus]